MGQKKDYRHLMEAVSDICFGVAEVDFSANQVYVLHNQLRPHEVGCAFAYDEYLAKYLKDLGSEQDGFADLLTSEELLDSFVSGQTSIDINAYNCTLKIKFFIKDQSGHKIFFSNRNPKAQTQPRRDTEPGVGPKPLAQSVVPYGCGNDQLWVGSVGGNGASVSLSSTAGFTALQESASQNAAHLMSTPARPAAAPGSAPQSALEEVAPDQAAVRGGACWDGVERRGVDPAYLTGLSPQGGAAAYTALRCDKTETPAAYAVPEPSAEPTEPNAELSAEPNVSSAASERQLGRPGARAAAARARQAAQEALQDAAREHADLAAYCELNALAVPPELQAKVQHHKLHPGSETEVKTALRERAQHELADVDTSDESCWLKSAYVFKRGGRTKVSVVGLDLIKVVATTKIYAHFVVLKSASNNILQQITTAFVFANCDYFIYIDPRKGTALMFVGSHNGTPLPPRYATDYNTEMVHYAQRYVVPEDRIAMIHDMELNHVIAMLRHKEAYITYCGVQDPVRGYTRKRLEYRYTDAEKKMISLVRTDITEIYELERFHRMKLQEALDLAYSDPLTSVLNKHGFTTKTSALLTDLELQCRHCRLGRQQLRSHEAQQHDFTWPECAPSTLGASAAQGAASKGAAAAGVSAGVSAGAAPELSSLARCMGSDCTFAGALLFIDLDNFKPVNDTYGHIVGDELLIKVASLIKSCVRTTDLVGRYGGDEFVVYLLCIGRKSTACSIAQRICDGIAQLRYCSQGEPINVSCSIGLAMAPYDGFTYDDLVAVADHRLYLAKHQGKSKVVASSYDLDSSAELNPEQAQLLAQLYPYCASCVERGSCHVAAAMLREPGLKVPAHVCHS